MNKKEFCKKYNLTEEQFTGEVKIDRSLYLSGLTSIPEGFNPTVGGSLDLRGLTSIPEGFNPTVGGDLYLDGLTSIPDGFNPTVGGYLDLDGLTSIPEGFNPTVGGYLDLRGLTSDYTKLIGPVIWGDKYIKADGIFTEIISVRGRVFRVKKLCKEKVFYLVTDGNGKYAHGDSLSEAREDLIYKLNSDVNKDDFKDLKLTDKLNFEQAIACYRAITGACGFGVKGFVERNKIDKKEKYSVKEIIKLTKGEFGSEVLKKFFIK